MNLLQLLPALLPRSPVALTTLLLAVLCASAAGSVPTEREQTIATLDFWLRNMVRDHHYTLEEVVQVTGWPSTALEDRIAKLGQQSAFRGSDKHVKVLPYPGGRHPRIGFLEGAIDPLRGTKVSIFPPWQDGGYVVLDIPEAIFSNLGLVFLAHTHVPTIWTAQNVVITNQDWLVETDGALRSEWHLPNGIAFGMQVAPQVQGADFELWLKNGTKTNLTGLRTQICLMLKAAPGFNEQNQERKDYDKPLVVVKALDAARYLLLAFEHCGRVWGNERCPCVHSDPVLPDAAPGERVSARGRLRFYEGTGITVAKERLLQEIQALSK